MGFWETIALSDEFYCEFLLRQQGQKRQRNCVEKLKGKLWICLTEMDKYSNIIINWLTITFGGKRHFPLTYNFN
jgi:hypothetical protein